MSVIAANEKPVVDMVWDAVVRQALGRNPFSWSLSALIEQGDVAPTFGTVSVNNGGTSTINITAGIGSGNINNNAGYMQLQAQAGDVVLSPASANKLEVNSGIGMLLDSAAMAANTTVLSIPTNTWVSFAGEALGGVPTVGVRYQSNISSLVTGVSLVVTGFFHATNGVSPDNGTSNWNAAGTIQNVGGEIKHFNPQAGSAYTVLATDRYVGMSNNAVRTVSLPGASPAGTEYTIVDTSGSVTAGNTITISATSGNISGAANTVITPGTNKSVTVVSDGTNYWITAKI